MLWIGVLPALSVFYVRRYVKEPGVWVENRRLQRVQNREVHVPLLSIFKRGLLYNTLTACWWMASNFILYYSLTALFVPHLQKDLHLSPTLASGQSCFSTSWVLWRWASGAGPATSSGAAGR